MHSLQGRALEHPQISRLHATKKCFGSSCKFCGIGIRQFQTIMCLFEGFQWTDAWANSSIFHSSLFLVWQLWFLDWVMLVNGFSDSTVRCRESCCPSALWAEPDGPVLSCLWYRLKLYHQIMHRWHSLLIFPSTAPENALAYIPFKWFSFLNISQSD